VPQRPYHPGCCVLDFNMRQWRAHAPYVSARQQKTLTGAGVCCRSADTLFMQTACLRPARPTPAARIAGCPPLTLPGCRLLKASRSLWQCDASRYDCSVMPVMAPMQTRRLLTLSCSHCSLQEGICLRQTDRDGSVLRRNLVLPIRLDLSGEEGSQLQQSLSPASDRLKRQVNCHSAVLLDCSTVRQGSAVITSCVRVQSQPISVTLLHACSLRQHRQNAGRWRTHSSRGSPPAGSSYSSCSWRSVSEYLPDCDGSSLNRLHSRPHDVMLCMCFIPVQRCEVARTAGRSRCCRAHRASWLQHGRRCTPRSGNWQRSSRTRCCAAAALECSRPP
jgi:hypothetical protein